MEEKKFNYGKAEADLEESGCSDSDEIYGYRSQESRDAFLRENGLNPERYYEKKNGTNSGNSSSGGSNDSGGCYLTSACVNSKGMPDNCDELMILRNYRDTYLAKRKDGFKDIAHYYKTAPLIVECINKRSDALVIWNFLYDKLVCPCVSYIKNGKNEEAYNLYRDYTLQLEYKYLKNK